MSVLLDLGVPDIKSLSFLSVCLVIEMSTQSALASRHTLIHAGARAETHTAKEKIPSMFIQLEGLLLNYCKNTKKREAEIEPYCLL